MSPELPPRLQMKLLRRALAEQMEAAAEMRRQAGRQCAGVERSLWTMERMSEEMRAHLARVRRIRLWWE